MTILYKNKKYNRTISVSLKLPDFFCLEKLKCGFIVALSLHTVRYNKEKPRETLKYER